MVPRVTLGIQSELGYLEWPVILRVACGNQIIKEFTKIWPKYRYDIMNFISNKIMK